jgi:hypothetical protein
MSKHTKAPWQTSIGHDARGYPYFYIHGMSGEQKRDESTLDANAQLIACAPELLSLCIEMRDWLKPEVVKEPDRTFFWKLVNVIRKASNS